MAALVGTVGLVTPLVVLGGAVPASAATSYTVTATVPVGGGPYGVAVNATTNTVYAANDSDNTLSVISGVTNTVTAIVPGGRGPGVAVNATTNTVYVTNSSGNTVSVIGSVTVPGVPTGVSATAGNGQASVAFTASASDGGSAITGNTVIATDTTTPGNGGQTTTGTGSPIVVTGLTNRDSYTFTVTATNAIGAGAASAASSPVVPSAPVTVPGVPTDVSATAGNGQASVVFTPPS